MVDDDLPTVGGFFEDEGEDASGVSTIFFASVEVVFADADGEIFIERVNFEVGEGERTHGGARRVVALVLVNHAGVAAGDLMCDEESVGGVFVAAGEGCEVAFVPGSLLGEEDLDDIELLARRGVERV